MKKKVLLSMALVSAVTVGGTPLTSNAAETDFATKQTDKCYKVIVGQGIESLSETLKELGIILGNNGNICPEDEDSDNGTSDVDIPEAPKPPITEIPDIQEPDGDISDETALSYAEQVVKLVNEERAKAGLPALFSLTKDI